MYADIFSRYENLRDAIFASGQKISLERIMERVLESEAPCFYYNENSAVKVYYRFMAKRRKRNKERELSRRKI